MASEKRLINVGELNVPKYKETGDLFIDGFHQGKIDAILEVITLTPTVDAVEVVHGRWIDAREYCGDYMCSNCDALYGTNKFNYCPHCGAKMDLKE